MTFPSTDDITADALIDAQDTISDLRRQITRVRDLASVIAANYESIQYQGEPGGSYRDVAADLFEIVGRA